MKIGWTLGGGVLGLLVAGLVGLLLGAFLGWVIAYLLDPGREDEKTPSTPVSWPLATSPTSTPSTLEERVTHLEWALEQAHKRIERLERARLGLKVEEEGGAAAPSSTLPPRTTASTPARQTAAMASDPRIRQADPRPAPSPVAPSPVATAPKPQERTPTPPPSFQQKPPTPPTESWTSVWARWLSENLVAKLGVVILFFGVGFLLKYAYDHAVLPPWSRLLGVGVVAVGMWVGGARMLAGRRLYGLILQGGGVGLAYLDVYFALKTFILIGPTAAFALFMALGVVTLVLAVRQDAPSLAVLGLIGAFLAPILAATGSGTHILLFSYYTLLNLVILGVSWFKSWRALNLVGFFFTFVVALTWGWFSYRPEHFATVEPFLIGYFAIYLAIPILFAQRQPPELKGWVDGLLVFGTPLAVAALQAGLVQGMEGRPLAWSAAGAALLYLGLGLALLRRETLRLLAESELALAIAFTTLAFYFAFEGYPTFALWTLEGAGVVWLGIRQNRPLARGFGMLLQGGAAGYFLHLHGSYDESNPFFNDFILGCSFIALAGWLTGWLYHRYRDQLDSDFAPPDILSTSTSFWAAAWWLLGGLHLIWQGILPHDYLPAATLAWSSLLFAASQWLAQRLDWAGLRRTTHLHTLVVLLTLLGAIRVAVVGDTHPLDWGGWVVWPVALAIHFWILHRQHDLAEEGFLDLRGAIGWLAMVVLASWEALWCLTHVHEGWALGWSALGWVAAYLRFRLREQGDTAKAPLADAALMWSLAVGVSAWYGLCSQWLSPEARPGALVGGIAVATWLFERGGQILSWPSLRRATLLLLPILAWGLVDMAAGGGHPGSAWSWGGWLLALVSLYDVALRQEREETAWQTPLRHLTGYTVALVLIAWEWHWQIERTGWGDGWQGAGWGMPLALGIALPALLRRWLPWPLNRHHTTYQVHAPLLWAILGLLWSLSSWINHPGDPSPLPYLPLLNPLDLTQVAILAALLAWWRAMPQQDETPWPHGAMVVAVLGFGWLNAVVVRSVHHWGDIPFAFQPLWHSILVQSALSLLWSVSALALMLFATRRAIRWQWSVGATLLGMVVLKLFVVDMANTGTVARIVSFIGVGVLLLLIGYIAPVPPGDQEAGTQGEG